MAVETAGKISLACALSAGIGLYFVVGWISVLIGLAVLIGVFIALAFINAFVLNKDKTNPSEEELRAGNAQCASDDYDGEFVALTVLSLIVGIALGAWINYLVGESSMITWLGGWIVVEFVAVIFYGLLRRSAGTAAAKAASRDADIGIRECGRDGGKLKKGPATQESYVYDLLFTTRPCENCGERLHLNLVRGNQDNSYLRCDSCFALQSLNDIIDADPAFLLSVLRDLFEQDEFETALKLLCEILKHQTLKEIDDTAPMFFVVILRELSSRGEYRIARLVLHEVSKCGNAWAKPLASYFKQYECSIDEEYPYCDRPDPRKLVPAFFVMVDGVNATTPNQTENLLAILEMSLDLYARMESNSIERLREYFTCVVGVAENNDYALAPLKDVGSLLRPFEEADAEFYQKQALFAERLDLLAQGSLLGNQVELLKNRYSILFSPLD